MCRWLRLHGLADYSRGCEGPAEQRSGQCQGPPISRKQVCWNSISTFSWTLLHLRYQSQNVIFLCAAPVVLGSCWMWTGWRSCWRVSGTQGYKCVACLILAGSWTTSSTTARTVWILSAVPQQRPSREASSKNANKYHQMSSGDLW